MRHRPDRTVVHGAAGTGGAAGVVLAAGAGTRLRPLTCYRPKALCPVGGRLLVDHALDRLAALCGTGPDHLAVNAHHLADQVIGHCTGRAFISVEEPKALGTAGALVALRPWLAGRDVLLTNADAYLPDGLSRLAAGWDGERCRLLCRRVDVAAGEKADFHSAALTDDSAALTDDGRPDDDVGRRTDIGLRYVGACLLPAGAVATLPAGVAGLYEVLWRAEHEAGRLEFAVMTADEVAVDCGTPDDYLLADRLARARARGRGRSAATAQRRSGLP